MSIGVGLYGVNGHQIQGHLPGHADAKLVATAAVPSAALLPAQRENPEVRHYTTLDELLANPRVSLVCLCSPRRRDQASEAIRCLAAGKHVYAEKPCAMDEADLDALIQAAKAAPVRFHEMAGTAFVQPFWSMKKIIEAGTIGQVVQVIAQKSYPWRSNRPQDEDVDGGLIMQCGVHAMRWVEHVAGVRVREVQAVETSLGNPVGGGGLRMAASIILELDNGGVGAIVANYLHHNTWRVGSWGNEMLRIFGTKGFIETVDGAARHRMVLADRDTGTIDMAPSLPDYFDMMIGEILGNGRMPLSIEDELHPTRMAIRAKRSARRHTSS